MMLKRCRGRGNRVPVVDYAHVVQGAIGAPAGLDDSSRQTSKVPTVTRW